MFNTSSLRPIRSLDTHPPGRSAASLLAIALALVASPAFAEDAETAAADVSYDATPGADTLGSGADAIIVTARRRVEKAQDVPISISVVSGASLERNGNFTLTQIQQTVPSLQVTATNPRNSNINIRGLGANSAIAVDGLEYGVGFYVDGVYYARPGQSQFDLVDIERIEVLRGPQGTLFGKNTTAGAINITTREPSFDPELTAEGSLGNYGYHQIRASGSAPIIGDKVAVRLTVADTHRDGFLTNAFDGRKAQDYDNFSVRGQLLIKPTEDVKVRLIGDYSKQKQHFSLQLVDGYFTNYANGARIANNIFDRAARIGYTLPSGDAFDRIGNADSPFQANMESYGVSGQIDWDLGPATLTSVTAYRWWDWYPKNDTDGTSRPINLKGQQENFQRQFSQELRLASNGTNTIDYQLGLFYFWQVIRGYGATQYGADFAEWNLNPATVPANTIRLTDLALTNFEADSYSDPRTKSYAAFGQADWHLAEGLTLTAGLRFTHEDKTGSFTRFQLPNSGLDLSGLSASDRTAVTAIRNAAANQLSNLSFSAKLKDDALSGLATLGYKVTPDTLVYATYSRGSKSGGLNVTAGGATVTPSGTTAAIVDPEKVTAYEIGVKAQALDGRITANAAAFLTEVRDYQSNVSEPVAPGSTVNIQYIANIPKVRSKGIEADLAFTPIRWINLTASAAYTDAKYVTYTNAPQAAERFNLGTRQDLSGARLPNVSKFAYTLGADVTQPLGETVNVYAHADWLHRSRFNATSTNSIYGIVPAYGVLNARIGLRLQDGRYDLAVFARNLLDKDYYVSRSGGTFGLISATIAEPRTYGVTLRAKL